MPDAHAANDPAPAAVPLRFSELFRAAADGAGRMGFDAFMELALYHPEAGYYRAGRERVGRGGGTDFFTASTSGVIFGELVAAACRTLLGGEDAGGYTFVEIGAEPGRGVLGGVAHGFGGVKTLRVGEALELRGNCVVFSNELFDAQPFRRFVFRGGAWRELGVGLSGDVLREVEIISRALPPMLPADAAEGCHIDLPLAAAELAERLAAQPWRGLFVAFDYGKSWQELAEGAPAGTARAYHRHRQHNDLLANPGAQDLTCHICWDWLEDALRRHGFAEPKVETQEAFFIRHAGELIAATATAEAARLSQRKLALLQLIHHMGQKFQVLHALRR